MCKVSTSAVFIWIQQMPWEHYWAFNLILFLCFSWLHFLLFIRKMPILFSQPIYTANVIIGCLQLQILLDSCDKLKLVQSNWQIICVFPLLVHKSSLKASKINFFGLWIPQKNVKTKKLKPFITNQIIVDLVSQHFSKWIKTFLLSSLKKHNRHG